MISRFFLTISILVVVWGCAGRSTGTLWREVAPHATERLVAPSSNGERSLRVGIASLFDVEMELLGECDSCHGASPNFWEFEYDNKLDSLAQLLWPREEVLRLVPGVLPFEEGDTLLDLLTYRLSRWSSADAELSASRSDTLSFAERHPLSPEVQEWASKLASQFDVDLLLLPGPTAVRLYPEGNKPKGRVEVDHLFSIWDLRVPELLYINSQKRGWKVRGGEQIDRQTTQSVLLPIEADLKELFSTRVKAPQKTNR